jgi:hypothetical protein
MRRAGYRLNQFVTYLWPRPLGANEMAEVERVLGQPLAELFRRQAAGEQAHSWRVMRTVANGAGPYANQRELLQAALLHDVGKTQAPLSLADRTLVVLARRLAPDAAKHWAAGQPRGWRRPFVTARCHARWGAELCARAGAPPLTVSLVRRHQTPVTRPASPEDEMLAWLQAADDDN